MSSSIRTILTFALAVITAPASAIAPHAANPSPDGSSQQLRPFEENRGQTDAAVRYMARGAGYSLYLTANETVLNLTRINQPDRDNVKHFSAATTVLRSRIAGANQGAEIFPEQLLQSYSNYFVGSDPTRWLRNVPHYASVRFRNVYDGIDLVYHSAQRQLEYDFIVQPGADPSRIKMVYTGARSIRLDTVGNLVLEVDGGELVQHAPIAYQNINGHRRRVNGKFALNAPLSQVSFKVGAYDPTEPLVIDPVLNYATYLGGTGTEQAMGIAADSTGNAYVAGYTSGQFPLAGPIQPTQGSPDHSDAFVSKISTDGTQLLWSTYLGGSADEQATAISVDSSGNPVVVGLTTGPFPIVGGAQASIGGAADGFVAKLNASGTAIVWSSYLGGPDYDSPIGVAVDRNNYVVVAGSTDGSFPVVNAVQNKDGTNGDAFVARFVPAGNMIQWATYLGGPNYDYPDGLAVNTAGDVYVAGATDGSFPVKNAFQPTFGGGLDDGFIAKISADGTAIQWASYFGGTGRDGITDIQVDKSGDAFITGYNGGNLPTKNAVQGTYGGSSDAFVARIKSDGTATAWATYLGGAKTDQGVAITLDSAGNPLVAGYTAGSFPVINAAQATYGGGSTDAFAAKLRADGTQVLWASYFGGAGADQATAIAANPGGYALITGTTTGSLPTKNPIQASYGGGSTDAFVASLGEAATPPTMTFTVDPTTIELGKSAYLSWSSTDSGSCVASGKWTGTYSTSGTQGVTPTVSGAQSYTLTCSGPGGSVAKTASLTVTEPPPLPTVSLSLGASSINLGQSTTLTWSSADATSCIASNAWTGSKAPIGNINVSPTATGTYTYTLSCTGTGGTTIKSAALTVTTPPDPPTVTLTISPTNITLGQSSTLTWTSSGATSCVASGAWAGSRGLNGSAVVTPAATGNYSYTLACTGTGGTTTRTAGQIVAAANPPPSVSLSLAPTTIIRGASSTLSWSATNATSCAASGEWSGTKGVNGSENVTPTTVGSHTYTITCTGAGGSTAKSATLTVNSPAPTVTFTVAPTAITLGNSATLNWSATDTTSCSASGAWSGSKAASGITSVTPTTTGTQNYSLSCTGPGGTTAASTALTVNAAVPAPNVTLTVSPSSVVVGSSSTLSWSSGNADSCSASGSWSGSKAPGGGSVTVTPTPAGNYTYVLACTGSGGTTTKSAALSVTEPPPALTFTVTPPSIYLGNKATLTWNSTHSNACSASGEWSGTKSVSGTLEVTPTSTGTKNYTLACTGPGGSIGKSIALSVTTPLPTVTIGISPTSIKLGANAALTWASTNASSCTASGAWTGARATSGTETTTPTSVGTKTYSLACTGVSGTTTKSVSLAVAEPDPPPTVNFSANPTSLTVGQSSTLSWSSIGADSCNASGSWSGSKSTTGSASVTPTVGTTSYTLTCTGAGGNASKSVTLVASQPAPTLNLTATPAAVKTGVSSTLSWSTTAVDSCTASGAWSGSKATTGTQSVSQAMAGSFNYALACTGPGGSLSKTATIVVSNPDPLPTVSISASPASIYVGASSTVNWATSDATSCSASGAWSGTKSTSGSQSVTPTAPGTYGYTLACSGPGGTTTKSTPLTVNALPAVPTVTLGLTPASITKGQSSTISWSSNGADTCSSSGAWTGSRGTSGSTSLTPNASGSYVYNLSCSNAGGSTSKSATLTVSNPVPAPTITFAIAPSSMYLGATATATWSTTDASSCTGTGAWSGAKSTGGSQALTPTAVGSYSYTLSCSGTGGSASRTTTIAVTAPPPAPTVSLTASPDSIFVGQSSSLSWNASNAESCAASGAWSGSKSTSGSSAVTPAAAGSYTYALACTGVGGTTTKSVTVAVTTPPPPPTLTLSSSPTSLILGATSTLSWASENTTSCTASGSWTGSKALSGTEVTTPTSTGSYTYTMSCTGIGGSISRSASLTVNPPAAPTVTISATPSAVTVGGSSTLSWNASGASTCTASDAWSGTKSVSGSQTVTPPAAGTYNYTLACTNAGGTTTKTVSLVATSPSAPTINLTASPGSITLGSSSTIAWSTGAATACSAEDSWSGSKAISGSQVVTPTAPGSFTYTLTCSGAGGTATKSVILTVSPAVPAPTVTISLSPNTIQAGGASTLSWNSTNATSCSAAGSWSGTKSTSGTTTVSPTAAGNYTYSLACTGAGGSLSKSASLAVTAAPPVPTVTMAFSPTSMILGSSSTLAWTTGNATSCSATGAWTGTKATSGSLSVTPAATGSYTYGLSCTGPGGSSNQSAVLTVIAPPTPPALTVSTNPAAITLGESSTVGWTSIDTSACSASGAWSGTKALSGTELVTPTTTGSFTYSMACTGPGGSISKSALLTVNPKPLPTLTLSANPTTFIVGGSTTVSWSSNNASSCSASGSWSGSRAVSGSQTLTPPAAGSYSYTLVCTGPGGSVTKAVNVTVQPKPLPVVNLTIAPASINILQTATATWSATNATSCVASGDWTGSKPLSGTTTLLANLLKPTKTYTLTCTGDGGTSSATATLQSRLL